MKKYILIKNIILAFIIINTVGFAHAQSFSFYTGKFTEMQAKAKTENKSYFIYFYTNWCMPCKKMNETVFVGTSDFTKYANTNYYGYMADAESSITEGKKLADKYDVTFFPMIIVFTPEGMISERIDGFLDSKQMLGLLKRNIPIHGQPTGEYLYKNDDPPRAAFVSPKGKGLYKVIIEKQASEGYGVKMGTFSTYEKAVDKMKELQGYFHRNIIFHIDEKEGKPMYEVILGPFKSRRSALTYNEVLKAKNGYEGIIVDLAMMK